MEIPNYCIEIIQYFCIIFLFVCFVPCILLHISICFFISLPTNKYNHFKYQSLKSPISQPHVYTEFCPKQCPITHNVIMSIVEQCYGCLSEDHKTEKVWFFSLSLILCRVKIIIFSPHAGQASCNQTSTTPSRLSATTTAQPSGKLAKATRITVLKHISRNICNRRGQTSTLACDKPQRFFASLHCCC